MVIDDLHTERLFVKEHLEQWNAVFQKLIQIPCFFENEHRFLQLMTSHLEQLGAKIIQVDHNAKRLRQLRDAQPPFSEIPGRYSFVVRVPGTGNGRSLIVNSQLDIVPEGDLESWEHPPFAGVIDKKKNVIHGRGAVDDRAGIVISLALLEMLLKTPIRLKGDVIFYFVLEDEVTGNGTLLCLEGGHKADAAMIIDGTRSDRAINEHAGNMQVKAKVKGKAASVSVSHLGVNAVEVIARLLLHLKETVYSLNETRTGVWREFPSPFQFVIQKIHSEGVLTTVPDLAVAECYVTFPPPFSIRSMREFLLQQTALFSAAFPDATMELQWAGVSIEPISSNTSLLEDMLQGSARKLGMKPIKVGPSTGSSDMRHFVKAGIPCLLYGPGEGFNPHRPNEHYYLDDLPKMILCYVDFIRSWCGSA